MKNVICTKKFRLTEDKNFYIYSKNFKLGTIYKLDAKSPNPYIINIFGQDKNSYSFRSIKPKLNGIPYPLFEEYFEYEIKYKLDILLNEN